MRDQTETGTATVVQADPAEIMSDTAAEWLAEAARKEQEADELRRHELALRADIIGLRKAAYGIRNALDERSEAVEKHSMVMKAEQSRDEAEPQLDPRSYKR